MACLHPEKNLKNNHGHNWSYSNRWRGFGGGIPFLQSACPKPEVSFFGWLGFVSSYPNFSYGPGDRADRPFRLESLGLDGVSQTRLPSVCIFQNPLFPPSVMFAIRPNYPRMMLELGQSPFDHFRVS